VVAVVQARVGSSRLPGKVLADLGGRPLLHQIVRRLQQAGEVHEVALTTSDDPSDDALVEFCRPLGVAAHRGPVDDIVGRLAGAAAGSGAHILVRVWGDCPFVDPAVVDRGVQLLRESDADYVSNGVQGQRTYPTGLDIEVYRRSLLDRMANEVDDPKLREFPSEFVTRSDARVELLQLDSDLSALHLTVDYPADLEAARAIYAILEQRRLGPDLDSLRSLLAEQPELAEGFADAPRNIEYREYLATRARD
jgi:spore coat polysaccharide biosynthesis protein SpsF (cytidylyltransferase family)